MLLESGACNTKELPGIQICIRNLSDSSKTESCVRGEFGEGDAAKQKLVKKNSFAVNQCQEFGE